MSLHDALGGLRNLAQWFVWRLEWNAEDGKYDKTPCGVDGSVYKIDAGNRENWMTYQAACDVVARLRAGAANGVTYTLGFWMTKGCGYWFLDLDHALQNGQWLPFALQLCEQTYPGALVELTSSGRGLHIIGRGEAPPHRNKPEKSVKEQLAPLELEFYTDGRGIAFGLTGQANGSADMVFDVAPLCAAYFPYREISELSIVRRAEWRGPEDDDELIQRALGARKSAAAAFGNKASFEQLWRGEVEGNNENDMALASHLAFWAGADSERVERLMLKSGLVRDKWFDRRRDDTYLGMTVKNACASCENVYREPIKSVAIQTEMYGTPDPGMSTLTHIGNGPEYVSPEMYAKVTELMDAVAGCGDELQMHNEVIPQIRAAGVPGAFRDKIAKAVNAALKFWKAELPIKELRALLYPPSVVEAAGIDALPDWAKPYCFVLSNDRFFNLNNGTELSMLGFQAAFGRNMPMSEQGRRENPAEKCLHFWNMPIAERIGYMPGAPAIYDWQGVQYANLYSPSSIPEVAGEYTQAGVDAIKQFQAHLFDMCGRREAVFYQLLYWFAHNVQHPGRKIRWSPIIKGVHGDGKTLMSYVLRAAMGYRNVSTTSNATLSNKGGFTDWAVRGAVNIIEEIMLTGKERHMLYNATKEFITNNVVDINPKGAKSYTTHNNTNHYATSNHNDALPLEPTDRRWLVVFTPWSSLAEMMRYCGISAAQWKERTDAIDRAIKNNAGELRAWFLGVSIPPEFDVDGSAMMTPEKMKMMSSSKDQAETVAADIIATGAIGVTANVISSSMLSALLENRAQFDRFDVPRSTSLNHMLTRMGYSKMEKLVKWNGRSHSIWVRDGLDLDNESVRLELDRSALVGPALGAPGSANGLVAPTPVSA